jgi:hypothetical protein
MLKITHNAGFFSCCSIKLEKILEYFNNNKVLPYIVDTSEQFAYYKDHADCGDITYKYFSQIDNKIINYSKDINISSSNKEPQFSEYNKLNFNDLKPFIDKYFSLSNTIIRIIDIFIKKYNIDLDNTCGIMYRGNDKAKETIQPSYNDFILKALNIKQKNNTIRFLVQTDELEFLNEFSKYVSNSFHIEETPKIKKNQTSIQYILQPNQKFIRTASYIASLYIMSKCRYIITTSGNGEMWMVLYRGHSNGIYQYLRPKEYIYDVKNESYDPNQEYFWIDNDN